MPGLIDTHCHVLGSSVKVAEIENQPLTYVAQYARKMLSHALSCGFTAVRDVGGGDAGIARAVEDGLIDGPRVYFAGRAAARSPLHQDHDVRRRVVSGRSHLDGSVPDEEIEVAIEESRRRRKYVAAHCHPAESIARAARLGVRTIEHATLIDEASAQAVKKADAYVVPTLVIVRALLDASASAGLPLRDGPARTPAHPTGA